MNHRQWLSMVAALTLIQAFVASDPLYAAQFFLCNGKPARWNNGSGTVLYYPNATFPVGSTASAALGRARDAWNVFTPGSLARIALQPLGQSGWSAGNGRNDVAIDTGRVLDWSNGALGVTVLRFQNCSIIESDVLFNPAVTWNNATNPSPLSATISLADVGVHELGHSLGLNHEDRVLATMNSFYPNSGPLGNLNDPDPHANDAAGMRQIYGSLGVYRDLAASAFLRTGAGTSAVIPAPRLLLRGGPAVFPFTVSNRGNVEQSGVRVRLFLSTNRTITAADTFLGDHVIFFGAGSEATFTANGIVPTNMAPGFYFLGYLLDPTNSVFETDEDNNGVALTAASEVR